MVKFSCQGCNKRYPGCHSVCESYIEEKAKSEKERIIGSQERYINSVLRENRDHRVTTRRHYSR